MADGEVELGVTIDLGSLEEQFDSVAESFAAALDKAVSSVAEKIARLDVAPGTGGTGGTGGGAGTGGGKTGKTKVDADVAVDADDLAKGIQGAISGTEFKLNIDAQHLVNQIQSALSKVQFDLNVGGTGGGYTGGGGGTRDLAQQALTDVNATIEDMIGGIPKELREVFNRGGRGKGGLGDALSGAVNDLYSILDEEFSAVGKSIRKAKTPEGRAVAIFDAIGDQLLDITKIIEGAGGKNAIGVAKQVQDRLGVSQAGALNLMSSIQGAVKTGAVAGVWGLSDQPHEWAISQLAGRLTGSPQQQQAPEQRRLTQEATKSATETRDLAQIEKEQAAARQAAQNAGVAYPKPGEPVDAREMFAALTGKREIPRSRTRRGQAGVDKLAGTQAFSDLASGALPTPEDIAQSIKTPLSRRGATVNWGALQREVTGGGQVDLQALGVVLKEGGLRNIVQSQKTKELIPLTAITDEEVEAQRKIMGRKGAQSVPGVEGQVKALSAMQVVEQLIRSTLGDRGVEELLGAPGEPTETKVALQQLATAGGRPKQIGMPTRRGESFAHVGSGSPRSLVEGLAEQEAAAPAADPELARLGRRASNLQNQERIGEGIGLSLSEQKKKELEERLPQFIRARIEAAGLPDFPAIMENVLAEVERGTEPDRLSAAGQGKLAERGGSAKTYAAERLKEITNLLVKGAGDMESADIERVLGVQSGSLSQRNVESLQTGLGRDDARELRSYMSQVSSAVVGAIEPGPARPVFGGGRSGRIGSFRDEDVRTATAGEGRGRGVAMEDAGVQRSEGAMHAPETRRVVRRAGSTLANTLDRLKQEQQAEAELIGSQLFDEQQAALRAQGVSRTAEIASGNYYQGPEDLTYMLSKSGTRTLRPSVKAKTSQQPEIERINGIIKAVDEIMQTAGSAEEARSGVSDPDILAHLDERLAGGELGRRLGARDPSRTKNVTGDEVRRAAQKASIVSGEVPPGGTPEASFPESLIFAGDTPRTPRRGRGESGPPIVPPGGPNGEGVSGGGSINVVIVGQTRDVDVVVKGGGAGGGGGRPGGGTTEDAFARFRSQSSDVAGRWFGEDVSRLRQSGKTDAQIRAMAKEAGLGIVAAGEFTQEKEPTRQTAISRSRLNEIGQLIGEPPARGGPGASNEADEYRSRESANIRRLERQIPRRAFGPSLTDLLTNLTPVNDRMVEATERMRRELGQTARAITMADTGRSEGVRLGRFENILGSRIQETEANLVSMGSSGESQEAMAATSKELENYKKAHEDVTKAIQIHAVVQKQLDEEAVAAQATFEAERAKAPGGLARGAAYGVAGLASGVAALASGAFNALVSEAVNGLITGIGGSIERMIGGPIATDRTVNQLAAETQQGGAAAASARAAAGVGLGGYDLSAVAARAQGIEGNRNLLAQAELMRAQRSLQAQGRGLPAGVDESVRTATGGIFGSGVGISGIGDFVVSTQEQLQQGLQGLPSYYDRVRQQAQVPGGMGENDFADLTPEQQMNLFTRDFATGLADNQGGAMPSEEQIAASNDILKSFNEAARGASKSLSGFDLHVATNADELAKSAELEASARAAGLDKVADAIKEKGLTISGADNTGATLAQALSAWQKEAAGINVKSLLAASEPEMRAQAELRFRQLEQSLTQTIPNQLALQRAAAPLPTGEDITRLGEAQGQDLSKQASEYKAYQTAVDGALESTKAFVAAELPQFSGEFNAAVQGIADTGREIAKIQIGVQIAQAAYSAHQYANSLHIARRSLQDARALAGDISKANKDSVGALERQTWLLNRQSQSLSLAHTQRQIDFQKAIAGFVVPGETPEEQAARVENAELSTRYAQKQLDIQKKLFDIGGKSFTAQASRQVRDLAANLDLLKEGRQVELKTERANLDIARLQQKLTGFYQKADAIYATAEARVQDLFTKQAELVAATGRDLNLLARDVVDAYVAVYSGLVVTLDGRVPATGGGGSAPKSGKGANGALFNTAGVTDITVGEAAGETVAVLKNPQKYLMPAAGGNAGSERPIININVTGNKFTTEEEQDALVSKLTSAITRQMGRDASLYGLRRTQ